LLDITINLEMQVSVWRREYGLRSLAGKGRAGRPIYSARRVQSATKLNSIPVVLDARFEVSVAVKIQVEVFWVVAPCNFVMRWRLHGPQKHFVSYHNNTRRHNLHDLDLQ